MPLLCILSPLSVPASKALSVLALFFNVAGGRTRGTAGGDLAKDPDCGATAVLDECASVAFFLGGAAGGDG